MTWEGLWCIWSYQGKRTSCPKCKSMQGNWLEGGWLMNCSGNKSPRSRLCGMLESKVLQMTHQTWNICICFFSFSMLQLKCYFCKEVVPDHLIKNNTLPHFLSHHPPNVFRKSNFNWELFLPICLLAFVCLSHSDMNSMKRKTLFLHKQRAKHIVDA